VDRAGFRERLPYAQDRRVLGLNPFLFYFFSSQIFWDGGGVCFTILLAYWLAQPSIDRLDVAISIVIVGATAAEVRVNYVGRGGGVELHWGVLFFFFFFCF